MSQISQRSTSTLALSFRIPCTFRSSTGPQPHLQGFLRLLHLKSLPAPIRSPFSWPVHLRFRSRPRPCPHLYPFGSSRTSVSDLSVIVSARTRISWCQVGQRTEFLRRGLQANAHQLGSPTKTERNRTTWLQDEHWEVFNLNHILR